MRKERNEVDFEVANILLDMSSKLPCNDSINQCNQDIEDALATLSITGDKPTVDAAMTATRAINDSTETPLQPNKFNESQNNTVNGSKSIKCIKSNSIVHRKKGKKSQVVLRVLRQKQETDALETLRNHLTNLPSLRSIQENFLQKVVHQ